MLFWHVGGAILLFRYLFKDPNVDLRFLALGAIVSDLIDKPIGRIFWADYFNTSRLFGHTLLFFVVTLAVVMLVTSRGSRRRQQGLALAVGVMFHLILDAMWLIRETLLWPLFGWTFPPSLDDYWAGLLSRILSDPLLLAQEAVGLAYLVFLWRRANLSDPERRFRLWRLGTIAT